MSNARYGEQAHPSVVDVDPVRDDFEIALLTEGRRRNLPILAICRGIQILNVACGGTLVQDIPTEVAGAIDHSWTVPPHKPYDLAHEVWLDKDTLLARLMRERLSDTDACGGQQPQPPGGEEAATVSGGRPPRQTAIERSRITAASFCSVSRGIRESGQTGNSPLFEGFLEAIPRK